MHALVAVLALLLPLPALAHPGHGLDHGFGAGFLHPFTGVDHMLAMVALGLWAGLLGGRARLALPGAFLGAMAVGGALAVGGLALPLVEGGILVSIVVLGGLAALMLRLPLAVGMALAAVFGLLHGHAHGTEVLAGGSAFTTSFGFLLATALLHGLGLVASLPFGLRFARLAGGATAMAGVTLALFT